MQAYIPAIRTSMLALALCSLANQSELAAMKRKLPVSKALKAHLEVFMLSSYLQGNHMMENTTKYVGQGADINAQYMWGNSQDTLLHMAINKHDRLASNQIPFIQFLFGENASCNIQNSLGQTPLHRAVRDPELVILLTQQGADTNIADNLGNTPLQRVITGTDFVANDATRLTVVQLLAPQASLQNLYRGIVLAVACNRHEIAAFLCQYLVFRSPGKTKLSDVKFFFEN
jgi:ankyrin repeat protein